MIITTIIPHGGHSVAHSVKDAVHIFGIYERLLLEQWRLTIAQASKYALGPASSEASGFAEFEPVWSLKTLGMNIAADASMAKDCELVEKKVRAAFWSNNARIKGKATMRQHYALLRRVCDAHVVSHAALWPYVPHQALQLDRLQRKLLVQATAPTWLVGDTVKAFNTRTYKQAAKTIQSAGVPWSQIWIKQQTSWITHLSRHSQLPARKVLCTRQSAWIKNARTEASAGSNKALNKRQPALGWVQARFGEAANSFVGHFPQI